MRFKELPAALKKGVAPLWLVTGEEPLLMIEACDALRAAARAEGYTERQILDARANWDWSQVFDACRAMSLFAEKRIVEIRLTSFRVGTKGSETLTALASEPLDGVVVIISMPSDWSVKKLAWWKKLTAAASGVECSPVSPSDLPLWLRERLARYELSADAEAIELLASRCEGNLLAASQEVLKLSYQYDKGTRITGDMVKSGVLDVARFDTEKLLDAALTGDAGRALRVIENLKNEGEAIPAILWQITDEVRFTLLTRTLMDAGKLPRDALWEAGVRGQDKAARIRSCAQRNNRQRLEAALMLCADIERLGKGLVVKDKDGDAWLELASLTTFLANPGK